MITAKKVRKKVLMRAGTLLVLAFLFVSDAPVPSAIVEGMPKGSWTTFVWSGLPVLLTPITTVRDKEQVVRLVRSLAAHQS